MANTSLDKLDTLISLEDGSSALNSAITRQYELSGIDLSGNTLTLSGSAVSILVTNISTTNDGQVSFNGGTAWYDIPKNYGGVALDSNVYGKIYISSIKLRAKTGTIDSQIITLEEL